MLVVAYSVTLSYLSALRYWSYTDAWDLGGFVQSIWSASHGHLLDSTLNSFFYVGFPQQLENSFLAIHFSPFLFLLVPAYVLAPSPVTLLVIQSIVVAMGILPIYWLAKDMLTTRTALALAFVYMMYPPMLGLSLDNFHPETFIPTLMMFAIYFALEENWLGVAISSALAMSTIEQGGYLIAALGVFLFFYHRIWRRRELLPGLTLLIVASAGYSVVATYARAYFGLDPNGFTLTLNSANFQVLGVKFAEQIPAGIIANPIRAASALSYAFPSKLLWMISVLAPVAFLPAMFPEALILATPYLPVAFFSNYLGYYSIYGIEQAFLIVSIFPATILGLKRLRAGRVNPERVVIILLILSIILAAALDFPTSTYGNSFAVGTSAQVESRVISLIPANASVLTTSDIFPHVAARLLAYTIPPASLRGEYSNIDNQILSHISPEYIMLNTRSGNGNDVAETNAILSGKVYNGSYGLVAYSDGVLLLKSGYEGQPLLYVNPTIYNTTNLAYDPNSTTQGPNDSLQFAKGTNSMSMWFGPYTFLPAGNYSVTFTLKTTDASSANQSVITLDVEYQGSIVPTSLTLVGADLASSSWRAYTLTFQLQKPVYDIQFRGMYPSNSTGIVLRSIVVR